MSDDISLTEAERTAGIVRCDACPVLCRIRPGRAGACDRYANDEGRLVRVDPLVLLAKPDVARVAFVEGSGGWRGELGKGEGAFVTGIGATTTYPDYKPAPFIVSSRHDGVDMVTVVTEGIFSYCGVKVKIDTDRYLGPEQAAVRVKGEAVGHVTTAEYGSQMLSLGGVHHLTGGSKKEGVITCDALLALCIREAVELSIDGGSTVVVQANKPPIVNGVVEERMRVGCGSAAIGMFAPQWHGHVDEVIVVDDHITGVLSEHQGGAFLDMKPAGIRVRGRRSTPGRYFQVAEPGLGWGGTDVSDPLEIIDRIDPKQAWSGLRLLMVSTTGEHSAWFELDNDLKPEEVEAIRFYAGKNILEPIRYPLAVNHLQAKFSMPALLATALHPLYKNFIFDPYQHGMFDATAKGRAITYLNRVLGKVNVANQPASTVDEEPPAKKLKPSILALNLPGYSLPPATATATEDEVEAWKKVELSPSTLAECWKAQANSNVPHFKKMVRVARACGGVPAVSAECERNFSAERRC